MDRNAPALLGIVLYPGVEPIDVGGTIGVASMAGRLLPNLRATTLAATAGPLTLAGGLIVHAEHALAAAPMLDAVIVTGGPGWPAAAADPAMLAFLRAAPAPIIASVCTGALILHAAGRLDGRPATTRRTALGNEAHPPLQRLGPAGHAALVVDDGDIVTGGGVALAHDLTLHLIARLYGPAAAHDVACAIEYDRAWAANQAALPTLTPRAA